LPHVLRTGSFLKVPGPGAVGKTSRRAGLGWDCAFVKLDRQSTWPEPWKLISEAEIAAAGSTVVLPVPRFSGTNPLPKTSGPRGRRRVISGLTGFFFLKSSALRTDMSNDGPFHAAQVPRANSRNGLLVVWGGGGGLGGGKRPKRPMVGRQG